MKKNYPIPDGLATGSNVVSATGFTGLIPSSDEEMGEGNYTDIYTLPQQEAALQQKQKH